MPPRDKQTEQGQQPPEPDPVQQSTEPPAGTVRLVVQYPHDILRVGEGDALLEVTSAGTDVPADREEEVRAAAKNNDVSLRKVT